MKKAYIIDVNKLPLKGKVEEETITLKTIMSSVIEFTEDINDEYDFLHYIINLSNK